MAISIPTEEDVRRIAREEAQRPILVTQRTVERVVGLPPRDYLVAARTGAFASTKERRLIVARTVDVLAYFERRLALAGSKPANDADHETIALARVGARRVAS